MKTRAIIALITAAILPLFAFVACANVKVSDGAGNWHDATQVYCSDGAAWRPAIATTSTYGNLIVNSSVPQVILINTGTFAGDFLPMTSFSATIDMSGQVSSQYGAVVYNAWVEEGGSAAKFGVTGSVALNGTISGRSYLAVTATGISVTATTTSIGTLTYTIVNPSMTGNPITPIIPDSSGATYDSGYYTTTSGSFSNIVFPTSQATIESGTLVYRPSIRVEIGYNGLNPTPVTVTTATMAIKNNINGVFVSTGSAWTQP